MGPKQRWRREKSRPGASQAPAAAGAAERGPSAPSAVDDGREPAVGLRRITGAFRVEDVLLFLWIGPRVLAGEAWSPAWWLARFALYVVALLLGRPDWARIVR